VEGCPARLASSYYPAKIAAGTAIAQHDSGPGEVYARLAERGYAPARFCEQVRARMPDPWEAGQLLLPHGIASSS
jgi:GntR family transcriptional regulator